MTILKPGYLRWDGSKYVTDSNINISLGGDVAGNNTGVTVIGIQGRSISSALPGDGFVLAWSAAANSWRPISLTADLGPAGGDLSGTYPSPTVAKIQGNSVKSGVLSSANDGYVLTWVNANNDWEPVPPSGGISLTGDVNGPAGANHVDILTGVSSIVNIAAVTLQWKSNISSPVFKQLQSTTGAGQTLTVSAQSARAGFAETGGSLVLESGITDGTAWQGIITVAPTNTFISGAGTNFAQFTSSVINLYSNSISWVAVTGTPSITQAQQVNTSPPQSITIAPQAPGAGAANPTNGTAGSLIVNLSAPTNGTNEAAFVVERAGTTKLMSVQQYPGLAGTVSLVLNNGAATAYTLYNDASNNTHISTVSGGAIYFENAGAQLSYQLGSGFGAWHLTSIRSFEWDAAVATPIIQQLANTANTANQNITIQAQGPWNNVGNTFNNAGDVIVNTPASVNGSITKYGGFQVQYAGTPAIRMGAYQSSTTYGAIWFADGGSAIASNWGFLGNQSATWLNAPTNAATVGFTVGGSSLQSMVFSGTTAALLQFGSAATSGITINQVTAANNVTAANFKISAQGPGGGTSLNPGDLILEIPKSISANTFYGGVRIQQADPTTPVTMIRMGMYGGPTTTYAGIWFVDAGAPGGGNFGFLGNQSQTYLNNPSSVTITIGGTAGNGFTLTGGASQQVLCGTAVTSAQWGTNLANAVWNLAGGSQVTVLSLKAPGAVAGTGNLSITGSIQNTYRSVSATTPFTVDTTTTDAIIRLVAVSPAQTVTLPAATVGRVLEFLIDLTGGGGDSTITFSAAGTINGAASPLIIGPFVSGSMNRLLCRSDGTNWFIVG